MSEGEAGVAFLVQDVDALGGSERQALALARTLRRRGRDVLLLTTQDPARARPWSEERDGFPLYRLPPLLFETAAGGILQRHRTWGTIYAVGIMMGAFGVRLGRLFSAPVAIKLACSGRWGDMEALARLAPEERIEVRRDLASAHLICISGDIAREAAEAGFGAERLVRLPNGVCPPAWITPVRPVDTDLPTVLFAGRLDQQKGADLLVRASALLETPVQLLVAGDGPQARVLADLAHELGVAETTSFLGRRDDVWGLMAGATVCCLPSRGEGMSNTLLEAMSAGAPIVASRIPANAEVLGDGEAGLLATPDDPADLARALSEVLGDEALRTGLAEAGRERVRTTYDLEVVADRHLELFARLNGGGPRPGLATWAGRFALARGRELRRGLRKLGGPR